MAEVSEDDPLLGTLIADRYRIVRKLGEGGMGVVYQAVHEALRKPVALKLLASSGRIDKEAVARFEREAIAAANLRHPNIAEATDFGRLPDGALYLVMEFVEGTTLRRLLRLHGKLPPDRALGILKQVASALSTAHARDVVHRDLKPENVIVTSADASATSGAMDLVKVIDFGIARIRNATFGGGATGLTKAGTVFGTPEYMAPEQVMGQVTDARADQYALGVLAFELLTGKPPFSAPDIGQLMMMHVGAPIPSTRDRTPTLSAATDAVITKMLGKLPDERFDSVSEAMDALSAALSNAPAIAPSVPSALSGGTQAFPSIPGDARPSLSREASPASGRDGLSTVRLGPPSNPGIVQAITPHTLRSVAVDQPSPSLSPQPSASLSPQPPSTGAVASSFAHSSPSLPGGAPPPATASMPNALTTTGSNPRLPPIAPIVPSAARATNGAPAADASAPLRPAPPAPKRPPIIALGIGLAAVLVMVLLVVLLVHSFSGPRTLSPEVATAVADWKNRKFEPAGAALKRALTDDADLANDPAITQALAASIGEDAARRTLVNLMETTALGRSPAMASALAAMAMKDDPQVRDPALELLRDRRPLLNQEQAARVRLRDADDCEELAAAKTDETDAATPLTQRDLERLGLDDCKRMLRVKELCECGAGSRPKALGSVGGPKGKGKGKDKNRND